MDDLLKLALLGTAKQAGAVLPADGPAAALAAALPAETLERKLLLAAGGAGLYRVAGRQASKVEPPSGAETETRAACSPQAAVLLQHVFANASGLIQEALQRLDRAALRLPPELLPLALETTPREHRLLLTRVLGARGRWLARLNRQWRWADAPESMLQDDNALPDDLEDLWQVGAVHLRSALLERVRKIDPQRGLNLLRSTWATEKAEHRQAFVAALGHGLSASDREFLESALRDRSAKVKAQGAELLVLIPGSSLANRMQERAEGMLTLETGKKASRLRVTPPKELPKDWEADGISAQPPPGAGKREHWMAQVISLVPPSHWESRFNLPPAQLVPAALADDFGPAVVQAWTEAAVRHRDTGWMESLWDFWVDVPPAKGKRAAQSPRESLMLLLLTDMEPAPRETRLLRVLEDPAHGRGFDWPSALEQLPRSWPEHISEAWLAGLPRLIERMNDRKQDRLWQWLQSLPFAAAGLPAELFSRALELCRLPEPDEKQDVYVRGQIEAFAEVIRTRADLAAAIPLSKAERGAEAR